MNNPKAVVFSTTTDILPNKDSETEARTPKLRGP